LREKNFGDTTNSIFFAALLLVCLWFLPDLIRINKYAPYFIVFGIFVFVVFGKLLRRLMVSEKITVSIDAIIKKDDVIQVFLQPTTSSQFQEESSLRKKIYGSDEEQHMTFVFQDSPDLNKVRIDVSQNANQLPIQIFKISFKRDQELVLEGNDIFNVFTINEFVTRENDTGRLILSKSERSYSEYDPFIFSTDLQAYFHDLKMPNQKQFSYVPFIISFLFSASLVFYLIFNVQPAFTEEHFLEYVFSCVFLVILILPVLARLLNVEKSNNSSEKRELAEKPILKISDIETYPKAFERYFNDNFGFRTPLIEIGGLIKTNIFKASPAPEKVTIGADNWIFLSGESYGVAQDIRRENLLSEKLLKTRIDIWLARRDTLAAKGIKNYKALWPDKHNIYIRYLPFSMSIQSKDTISKTDQMIGGLKQADSTLQIIDVRRELIEHSQKFQVYLKNDTHWNEYGAFIAYQKLMRKIAADFPAVLPVKTDNNYNINWYESTAGDLLNIMGLAHSKLFVDQVPEFIPKDTSEHITLLATDTYPAETVFHLNPKSKNNLRVLVFRDSFTRNLIKFISPHFKEVLYIWTPYDQKIVDRYKPDIVVEGFVERYFE
jgi:hypothetical protein